MVGGLGVGTVVVYSPKIDINLPGHMRSYIVKENHIGLAVSKILRYRQKDTSHTHTKHPVISIPIFKYKKLEVKLKFLYTRIKALVRSEKVDFEIRYGSCYFCVTFAEKLIYRIRH